MQEKTQKKMLKGLEWDAASQAAQWTKREGNGRKGMKRD